MNRDELIAFLKENLEVKVETGGLLYCGDDGRVKVTIKLAGEEISSDYDNIKLPAASSGWLD